ncbi:MAG: hypothetical protein IT584_03115, partial [Chlamydiae bacterium]|nr:hypothetical protein [Chlamydiota bacterium]
NVEAEKLQGKKPRPFEVNSTIIKLVFETLQKPDQSIRQSKLDEVQALCRQDAIVASHLDLSANTPISKETF